MPSTIVIGGSVTGLAAALALSQLGYDVTILERDPHPAPETVEEANRDWPRPTVPQAVHSHAFGSLGTNLLAERAPDVYAALVAAGVLEIDLAAVKPPTLDDHSPRPGDHELRMLGTRRATFDLVLRREVLRRPGVDVRLGTTVRGLELDGDAPPRVVGVRTEDGEVLTADLVIDASGRRTAAARWLSDAGLPVPDRAVEPCDITYYTRFYRLLTPTPPGPLNRGFGAGGLWDHYTAVLFLGDNGTASISIGVLPDDTAMKHLRAEAAFTAALRATPLLAPWVAPGASEPISPVYAMAGLDNSLRSPTAPDTQPVAGFYALGDSACTTNPAYGRGVSLALAHAYALADVVAGHPDVDQEQATAVAKVSHDLLMPWFTDAVRNDRGRAMLWRATVHGQPMPELPPGVMTFGDVAAAAAADSVVWRRLLRMMMSLDPPSTVYADAEVRDRVTNALAGGAAPHVPAPRRDELVRIVSTAAG